MSDFHLFDGQESIPALALRGLVLFPGDVMHFDVGREISVHAVEYALENGCNLYVVAQKDIRVDDPVAGDLYAIGTVAKVKQILKMPGDGIKVLAKGLYRAKTIEMHTGGDMLTAVTERIDLPLPRRTTDSLLAKMRTVKQLFETYSLSGNKQAPKDILLGVLAEQEPARLVEFVCANTVLPYEVKQEILEQPTVIKQLDRLMVALEREINVLQIEREIYDKVKVQLEQNQRDFVLREQMRIIQSELGEDDDTADELDEMEAKILSLQVPQDTTDHLMKNLHRLSKMPPSSQEANLLQTYLETCLELPWNTYTKQNYSISSAKRILERDHYGLQKVKERILEFIAVSKIAPSSTGQILCLVGPPGVGKTSIAKSVAEAMGRNYVRISLGGVKDEAEIRGHRKSYIGAMPGRIIRAMADAGSQNPLILLDEVDKLGGDYKGDPSSALLEVLDKAQNSTFRDHYIEVEYDLSNVLFITSANDASQIPGPLYDRMEIIELDGYTDVEKFNIAKRHLVPKQLAAHGLTAAQLRFSKDAIFEMIDGYTREAGVRSLERQIASCCRKAAKAIVSGESEKISLTAKNLAHTLGRRKFEKDDDRHENRVGQVTGLAWTSVGGDTLPIEVIVLEGSGKTQFTGKLGEVMQESAQLAVSYVRSIADIYEIPGNFYKTKDIHIHAPEGAVPKDGPSAGVTMTTALVSALTELPVRGDIAMTGEITLHGDVLPIGGLKEKSMAAYKNGYTTVLIPQKNLPDLEDVDQEVKDHLQFIPVQKLSEVLQLALVRPTKKEARHQDLPAVPQQQPPREKGRRVRV